VLRIPVVLALLIGCDGSERAPLAAPTNHAGPTPAVDAGLPPTGWGQRCQAAMAAARDAAGRIEPELATMAIDHERRPDREQVSAQAAPPVWKVAPIHVFAVRPPDSPATADGWQTFATYELGSDHRTSQRTAGDVSVAILADGWQPVMIETVLAAMQPQLEPCFAATPAHP
jgi:hypothetical protein